MNRDIIEDIILIKEKLPKKQKQLCNYIVINSARIAMMTVAELANEAGVGTTTVMRLVQLFKYESFNEFKHDIIEAVIQKENLAYGNKYYNIDSKLNKSKSTLTSIVNNIVNTLENSITSENEENFEKAIDVMLNSPKIYVIGLRTSLSAAVYFQRAVNKYAPMVEQLSYEQEFIYDKIMHIEEKDVVFVISQWPCTKKTFDVAKLCHERKIQVILLTNTKINPIVKYADIVLNTNSVSSSSDILPIMTFCEALAYEIGKRTSPESSQNLLRLEEMIKEHNLIIWEES